MLLNKPPFIYIKAITKLKTPFHPCQSKLKHEYTLTKHLLNIVS